jgi:hypothetical protein
MPKKKENRSIGVMEYWSIGLKKNITPLLPYSITPLFHHSFFEKEA